MSEHDFLAAIHDDDRPTVKRMLQADPTLATFLIREAKLYQTKISHWIYAGDTALHLAAAGHRVEVARLLLAAGADPNSCANHRRSAPLHYAADGYLQNPLWNPKKQVEMIQCLLDAGAEINAQDKNGATPLHRATRTRCAAAVHHFLEAGCDTLIRNKPGSTAFHLAVQNTGRGGTGAEKAKDAQRMIIAEFLSHGVSITLEDGQGKSVLDCARANWIREMLTPSGR